MRIHILGINYWPESTGIAVFATGRAEYLASCGHQVTMVTAVPYYPEWRVAPAYRRRPFARERRHGVDVRRCPLYVPARVTPVRRVIHEATFVATALLRSLTCPRPDVLFVTSPPLALAVAAVFLGRWWRAPYVFHVADLQPDTALDLGMMRKGLFARALYALERTAYRRAALTSTLTAAMRDRIVAKGIPDAKVTLFADWADPELFELHEGSGDGIRDELGLDDDVLVVHAGNMGVKQGLDVVLDAAALTRDVEKLTYVLVGDGAVRPALEARARALGLSNVRFVPLLPRPSFLRLLAVADVCLVAQQRAVADVVFPSKVLTLLAAGKPVVASVASASAVARVMTDSGAGEVVAPEDPVALAHAVEALRREPEKRRAMAAAGRAYARAAWERDATLAHLERELALVSAGRALDHAMTDTSRRPT